MRQTVAPEMRFHFRHLPRRPKATPGRPMPGSFEPLSCVVRWRRDGWRRPKGRTFPPRILDPPVSRVPGPAVCPGRCVDTPRPIRYASRGCDVGHEGEDRARPRISNARSRDSPPTSLATLRQWLAAFDAEACDRDLEAGRMTAGELESLPRARRSGIAQRNALRPCDAPRLARLLGLLPDPPGLRSRLSNGFPEHPEGVLAEDLADVGLGVAAPQQTLGDRRDLCRVGQQSAAAVEVAAQPDGLDPATRRRGRRGRGAGRRSGLARRRRMGRSSGR